MSEVEKMLITKALHKTNWNRRKAAKLLDISYRSLLYKINHQCPSYHRIIYGRFRFLDQYIVIRFTSTIISNLHNICALLDRLKSSLADSSALLCSLGRSGHNPGESESF